MLCAECGEGRYEELILPTHREDIGGVTVNLKNTVTVRRCPNCGDEQTMIPDMRGLVRVAALCRALIPVQLEAGDIKLMRRALGMTQRDFAAAMEVTPETVSRWEREGGAGAGGYAEKLVRYGVCSLLKEHVPHIDVDTAVITKMQVYRLPEGETLPIPEIERVVMGRGKERETVWDATCLAA